MSKPTMTGRGKTRIVLTRRILDNGTHVGQATIISRRGRGNAIPIPSESHHYPIVRNQAKAWGKELGIPLVDGRQI